MADERLKTALDRLTDYAAWREREELWRARIDLALYGQSIMVGSKRVDPAEFFVVPEATWPPTPPPDK